MPTTDKVLIVCIDDDEAMLGAVARTLRREPSFDVRTSEDPIEVLSWIANEPVAVLVSDYDMPSMTGAQLAAKAKVLRPETVRILLTGQRTLETAIDGINQGEIFRFINKPFDAGLLRKAVLEAVERHHELEVLSGDRQRRERREALRTALEAEYPGISSVPQNGTLDVTIDPWTEATAMGLVALDRKLES